VQILTVGDESVGRYHYWRTDKSRGYKCPGCKRVFTEGQKVFSHMVSTENRSYPERFLVHLDCLLSFLAEGETEVKLRRTKSFQKIQEEVDRIRASYGSDV